MVTHQSISALEKSINDILRETQDKTVDICCDCLQSLMTDNQGFPVDKFTVDCCINMIKSLKHSEREIRYDNCNFKAE